MADQEEDFLQILHAEAVAAFVGLPGRVARDLARSLCERIMLRVGGDTPYISNGQSLRTRRGSGLES